MTEMKIMLFGAKRDNVVWGKTGQFGHTFKLSISKTYKNSAMNKYRVYLFFIDDQKQELKSNVSCSEFDVQITSL